MKPYQYAAFYDLCSLLKLGLFLRLRQHPSSTLESELEELVVAVAVLEEEHSVLMYTSIKSPIHSWFVIQTVCVEGVRHLPAPAYNEQHLTHPIPSQAFGQGIVVPVHLIILW
jgi:hypothetical protein